MENKNIINSVEALFQSQDNIKKSVSIMLKIALVLFAIILLGGFIGSWIEIRRPEGTIKPFDPNMLKEGSLKYQNSSVIFVNDEYMDGLVAQIIDNSKKYTLSEILNEINSQLKQKVVLYPRSFKCTENKVNEVVGKIRAKNKKTQDSLNYILRSRKFLEYTSIGIFDRINKENNGLDALTNAMNQLNISFKGDFPSGNTIFSYQIGRFKSIGYDNAGSLIINCVESAPVISRDFLTRSGVKSSWDSDNELVNQSTKLKEIIQTAENIQNQKISEERKLINSRTSDARWKYRMNFFYRWYSTLLLLINSIIFILLLIRYWIIVRQKDLPRKSTDFVYYATNRTSRLFRIIALIIIFISITGLIVSFLIQLFGKPSPLKLPFGNDYGNLFIRALLEPIIVFCLTIIGTWFLLLMSEWIDFISNCYEIVFYKANKKDTDK